MADDAWCGPWAGGTDFAEKIDFRVRELVQNKASKFWMGDGCHETAADDGDFLAIQCVKTWSLCDFLHRSRPDWRQNGITSILFVLYDAWQRARTIDAFRIRRISRERAGEQRCK